MSKLPLSFRINMFFKHKARDTDWKTNWDNFQFRMVKVRTKYNIIVEGYNNAIWYGCDTNIVNDNLLLYNFKSKSYNLININNISKIETFPVIKERMIYHKIGKENIPRVSI